MVAYIILAITLQVPKNCTYVVSSGYRSPEKNRQVGGAENSYHLKDRARDIVSTKACLNYLKEKAQKAGLSTIMYDTHLHVDNRKNQICKEVWNKKLIDC